MLAVKLALIAVTVLAASLVARRFGHAAGGWRVIAYEDGFLDAPDRYVQRIAARRVPAVRGEPPRYPL